MTYYLYSLLLSSLLSLCLFIMLLYRLRINAKYQNKHFLSYLLPVVLSIAFIYFTIELTVPRALDLPLVLAGGFEVSEINIDTKSKEIHLLHDGNKTYRYNPLLKEIGEPGLYKISYSPRSRYVFAIERIADSETE